MENFRFENQTKILFGKRTQEQAGAYVKMFSDRALILYGSGRIKKTGLFQEITDSLSREGVSYIEFGGITANPRLSDVEKVIRLCRENGIHFILAVGGGSVIDAAKAAALGAECSGNLWDYFEKKLKAAKVSIKIGVVLTIPGSGSESSGSTVITNDQVKPYEKLDFTSNELRPCFAILNPELTMSLTWEQTACGGVDMLAHVMERYFTKVENVELTDRMCEAAMITIIHNLRKLKENLADYEARAEIMWAGTIAHNNMLSTGRRSDWASHMIEHEISAVYDIAHGDGLAMVFPSWMQYVYRGHLEIFAKYAMRVWGISSEGKTRQQTAEEGIRAAVQFYKELGKETDLGRLHITESELADMARRITKHGPVGDLEVLEEADVLEILRTACSAR